MNVTEVFAAIGTTSRYSPGSRYHSTAHKLGKADLDTFLTHVPDSKNCWTNISPSHAMWVINYPEQKGSFTGYGFYAHREEHETFLTQHIRQTMATRGFQL